MRATLSTTYRGLLQQLQNSNSRLEDLRLQGATGKKMSKPSDDPSGIRPVLNARGQIRSSERYLRTMGTAMDRLNSMDSVLNQVENLMVRAKETLVAAGNGSMSTQDLNALGNQFRQMKEELISLGNTQIDGKYIFSGYDENVPTFNASGIFGGDKTPIKLEIGPESFVRVNLTGDEIFGDYGSGDSLWNILESIETSLSGANPDSGTALAQMQNLDDAADRIRTRRSEMGNIAQRVEGAMLNMEDSRNDMKEILARYEDADILETLTNLTNQETAFKAALEITSQVSRLSILDYMR